MWQADSEALAAVRFWASVALGLAVCLYAGKLLSEHPSPFFLVFCLAVAAFLLTFYSPKLGLGLLVFSMLLSPRLKGAAIASAGMGSSIQIRLDDVFLIIVSCAWFARSAILKRGSFLVGTPVHAPMLLYSLACVLSTSLAIMRGEMEPLRPLFFVLKYVEYFVLYFMTVSVVETREDVRRYLGVAWLVAIVVSLYGYWQIPSGERVTTPFETPIGITGIAEKVKDNEANTYGGYCLVVFGVLLSAFTQGTPAASLLSVATFVFMAVPFAMTLSRSSYIGLAASVSFLTAATARRRAQLLFGVAGALIVLFMVPRVRTAVLNRILYTFTGVEATSNVGQTVQSLRTRENVTLEGSANARVLAWKRIFTVHFPRHPILGSGVTRVGLVDTQIPLVVGETGLVGLALFLWMLLRVAKMGWIVYRRSGDPLGRSVGLGLLAALVGLLFHSSGANTFIIVRVIEPFWFLAALCARLYDGIEKAWDSPLPLS